MASGLKPGAIVTDVGSVKGKLVEQLERGDASQLLHVVGAHPIAGKEKPGAAAGSEHPFAGARCILTLTKKTDQEALDQVPNSWQETGSIVMMMDPDLHDKTPRSRQPLANMAAFALMECFIYIRAQVPSLDPAGDLVAA